MDLLIFQFLRDIRIINQLSPKNSIQENIALINLRHFTFKYCNAIHSQFSRRCHTLTHPIRLDTA